MKKLFEYLMPIFFMLVIFYVAACLISGTIQIEKMDSEVRRIVFGFWLGVCMCFALGKVTFDTNKKDKPN